MQIFHFLRFILLVVLSTFAGLLVKNAAFSQAARLKQTQAQEISLPNINGDTVLLSSLKGKVVLVDFWASWCAPCRESNRQIAKLYQKYHQDGFEIYSVSIDGDSAKWHTAMRQDGVNWLCVNQKRSWFSPIVRDWEVAFLPTAYLLNKEGIIVAVNPGYGVIESWLKSLLEKS